MSDLIVPKNLVSVQDYPFERYNIYLERLEGMIEKEVFFQEQFDVERIGGPGIKLVAVLGINKKKVRKVCYPHSVVFENGNAYNLANLASITKTPTSISPWNSGNVIDDENTIYVNEPSFEKAYNHMEEYRRKMVEDFERYG